MIDFSSIRKRQWYALGGVLAFLSGLCLVFWVLATRGMPAKPPQKLASSLVTGASRTNPQEAWVFQFQAEAELTKKRLDGLEDMLAKLIKMNEAKQKAVKPVVGERPKGDAPEAFPTGEGTGSPSVESVREELKAYQNNQPTPASGQILPPPPAAPNGGMYPNEVIAPPPFRSKAVRKITLPLRNARSSRPLKSVDNTVPAGAFARAVLLGGVDASASIQASSDPRPALLRLTDAGTLPRKFHSDLKGCHALAACYGDISSERVFMRLEKLTCTERKTGEILEVNVQGYVAGEDGRTGIRGSVVDRAGESLRNVLIGGFLGGLGEFLSQSHNAAVTFSPMAGLGGLGGLAQTNPMGMKDMIRHGAGKGIHNALDKYADFYIKRAEQLQPVIQVAAGRQVDIVFTEGVSIGDSVYRQAMGKSNDQERYRDIAALPQYQGPGDRADAHASAGSGHQPGGQGYE